MLRIDFLFLYVGVAVLQQLQAPGLAVLPQVHVLDHALAL